MTRKNRQPVAALLEKEIRTSLPLILGMLIAPGISRIVTLDNTPNGMWSLLIPYIPNLIAVIWGASSGDLKSPKRIFERTHLPASNGILLLISFGLPFSMILLASCLAASADISLNGTMTTVGEVFSPLLASFCFAYFVSSCFAQRTGLAAGVIVAILLFASQPSVGTCVLAWSAAAGASLAVALRVFYRASTPAALLRTAGISVVAASVIIPAAITLGPGLLADDEEPFSPHTYTTVDNTITIKAVNSAFSADRIDPGVAEFRNVDTGRVHKRKFWGGWHAAGVVDSKFAYCIEADTEHRGLMITRWDTSTGMIAVIARLPVRPNWRTLCQQGHFASIDKRGRYMIARLPAIRNSSVDLWLIDLRKGSGQVVMQNASYFEPDSARWLDDRALIPSYRSRIIEVDLSAGTAGYANAAMEGN